MKLKHALAVLKNAEEMHATNAPLWKKKGKKKQAKLCRKVAKQCREGRKILECL